MKAVKVIAIKIELEMTDDDMAEIIEEMQTEMGESVPAERIFEDYVDSFQIPSASWLAEQFMEPNSYRLRINELEVVEIL